MDILTGLMHGFAVALQPANLLWCFVGVLLGTVVGVMPGLGPPATIAMLLPLTFLMNPAGAMIMLAGIYYGAKYGGATPPILPKVPRESAPGVARPARASAPIPSAPLRASHSDAWSCFQASTSWSSPSAYSRSAKCWHAWKLAPRARLCRCRGACATSCPRCRT